MRDYRTTVLISTPSYALVLADQMAAQGLDPKDLHLKLALLAGEPWTEAERAEIESRLYLTALENYALSEAMGPGVAGECAGRLLPGMHLNEDHFFPEVIDPRSGALLPPGELGELVLTTLTREATPLVRFRTGDLVRLDYAPCPCGRTLARMSRIAGRCDEVVIVKGINIFPNRVGQILETILGKEPAYQLVVGRRRPPGLSGGQARGAGRPLLRQDDGAAGIFAATDPQAGPGHRGLAAGQTGGTGLPGPGR